MTKTAIQRGFVHLDCSEMYGTEEEVGVAIQEAGVPRASLFVTDKVDYSIDDIPAALAESLRKLQTDYVDLYLIHTPFFAKSDADLQRAWAAMEQLKKEGKARSIGVSNYLRADLEATLATATDPPAINQIEYHAYLQRANDFVPWMRDQHNIQVASFKGLTPAFRAPEGPLRKPLDGQAGENRLSRIAKAHGVTPAAVLLAWLIQSRIVAVTTTTKPERLDEYAKALTITLTPEELKEITDVGATYHFRTSWGERFADDDRS